MELPLPRKAHATQPVTLTDAHQVTLIGANGAGKSRFVNKMVEACGDKAFRVSALRAIFATCDDDEAPLPGSIAERFNALNAGSSGVKSLATTEIERLNYIMLADEFRELMNFKAARLVDENVRFPLTKLDTVVRMWETVFPRNKVLRHNGKLLFSTQGHNDQYAHIKLSDGEKAVLYYLGAVLYAAPGAVIFVDDPETFIHPSIMHTLWNVIEQMRSDCTFIYNTHDVDFAMSRIDNKCIWIKSYDPDTVEWDYEVLDSSRDLTDGLFIDLLGARKPVLFIEGDEKHSIDARLYPLIFPDYTVKPLGSCNKVIESVRTFNSLNSMHHLDSWGIVDRDRRTTKEVDYLRQKKIMVPNVAEVENIFMLEGVIRAVARAKHKNEHDVATSVKRTVMKLFDHEIKVQALQHVRHRVKHDVEMRIDMKFRSISALEEHMTDLVNELNPRAQYEQLCRQFHRFVEQGNYMMVLRVFNQKQMIGESNVAALCGLKGKDDYVRTVLNILKRNDDNAAAIRDAIKQALGLNVDGEDGVQPPQQQ